MIRVEYDRLDNRFLYSSHRKLSRDERVIVESYILRNVAPKTDYYDRLPSHFIYLGIENELAKELNLYHLRNSLKGMVKKELEIEGFVRNLINKSLSNYYFELIGDEILALRKKLESEATEAQLIGVESKMQQLVRAYNSYSGAELMVEDIFPKDLIDRTKFSLEQCN
jgi:hypothetical protein